METFDATSADLIHPALRCYADLLQRAAVLDMHVVMDANRRVGRYFFETDTMRFFQSRADWKTFGRAPVVFFVVSDRQRSFEDRPYPRLYKVRKFDLRTGGVDTPEQEPAKTLETARRRARKMAEGEAGA